ncbi:MAG: DNA recombination protein RmuC [Proteobacteria bacterium]|nr:DNA recombination protein RmuC [Pseudomonadota bacterium]
MTPEYYINLANLLTILITCTSVWCAFIFLRNHLRSLRQELSYTEQRLAEMVRHQDEAQRNSIISMQQLVRDSLQQANTQQQVQLEHMRQQIERLSAMSETKLEKLREAVEAKLHNLSESNERKLEQIRHTVDEKLHDTLEKRLGESFKLVSERLEIVHQGLGEMQNLASGVGDLKRVLSNVKTRGIWGEVQLEAIITQLLTPAQYEKNVAVNPAGSERVEFAVKLPNKDHGLQQIWLPIDAKCPLDDYTRLINAQETGDIEQVTQAHKTLVANVRKLAKMISEKYIQPPHTTDFAIMFLPIEAMYAEILRHPGLIEQLQQEYRVVITSPSTLSALLNSLQMGFRTLAIEQRSSEVWKVLGSVKNEFVKFADILSKTKLKIDQASKVIGDVEVRSRAIQRHLRAVETADASNDPVLETLDTTELEQIEEA